MNGDEFGFLSAIELAAMIRTREISPVEVVQATLARIERYNPSLNAYVTLHGEEALAVAARAEAAVVRGDPLGPLHGVPLHVKDNLHVAGSRTTFGSKLMADNVTVHDCPAVERLRRAGMILVGRTNTPEFGWKGVTDNRVFGVTRNPWDTKLTPGGSSGGASAAVAAGLGPIGLGTDGGGSLRIPASFCGVFGFKATFGRVPSWPPSGGAALRHTGAITRTVSDMAIALDLMAGFDPRDLHALPPMDVRFKAELEAGIRGKRIAYSSNLNYGRVYPEVAAICGKAAARFVEAGARVEEVQLDWDDPYEPWRIYFYGAVAAVLEKKLPSQGDLLDPGLRRVAEAGLALRGVDFPNALLATQNYWAKARRIFERFDVLLCPTVAVPPFAIGQDDPDPIENERLKPTQWVRFTYPFNLTGQPAASVPAGWTANGLPIGLQIVGDRNADGLVLQAARAWEQIQPWSERRPRCAAEPAIPAR